MHYHHSSTAIIFVFFSCFSFRATNAQTTMAECGPNFLSLAPCALFVQGMAASPVQPCCDNLKQLYAQKPTCLCLLLNDTTLTSFPINTTLALQLPLLCNLQMDTSTCPGTSLPSVAPPTQVSIGKKPNSTVAASPIVTVAPRPSIMGFGFHHSGGEMKLKAETRLLMMILMATIFSILTNIISY
ncbi:hypothetical protein ACJIZ3_020808 [Penstemon smallii]|uniref:Bifunctional inhibitor/plant lipid transfer protein/seed storage helical domain-containing protein n=1 Tax=Penstemon smallii TaxID=265156 RepID=A0ABD3SJN0_9LAMI